MSAEPVDEAGRAADLGLAEYQYRTYLQLLEQADERGIPKEVIPLLARWLDRIDFGPLLLSTRQVAEVLGVAQRTIVNQRFKYPVWMTPLVEPLGPDGLTPVVSLWLATKVEAFRQYLESESQHRGAGAD